MTKFGTGFGLVCAVIATDANAEVIRDWSGTLPEHQALCERGRSGNEQDLGKALRHFGSHLRELEVGSVGFPYVKELELTTKLDGAPEQTEVVWTICVPLATSTSITVSKPFVVETIPAQRVRARLCSAPIDDCAVGLLASMKIVEDSSLLRGLRSVPVPAERLPVSAADRPILDDLLFEMIRHDTVQVQPGNALGNAGTEPVVHPDEEFVSKGSPRPLFVSRPQSTPESATAEREDGLLIVLPVAEEAVPVPGEGGSDLATPTD